MIPWWGCLGGAPRMLCCSSSWILGWLCLNSSQDSRGFWRPILVLTKKCLRFLAGGLSVVHTVFPGVRPERKHEGNCHHNLSFLTPKDGTEWPKYAQWSIPLSKITQFNSWHKFRWLYGCDTIHSSTKTENAFISDTTIVNTSETALSCPLKLVKTWEMIIHLNLTVVVKTSLGVKVSGLKEPWNIKATIHIVLYPSVHGLPWLQSARDWLKHCSTYTNHVILAEQFLRSATCENSKLPCNMWSFTELLLTNITRVFIHAWMPISWEVVHRWKWQDKSRCCQRHDQYLLLGGNFSFFLVLVTRCTHVFYEKWKEKRKR